MKLRKSVLQCTLCALLILFVGNDLFAKPIIEDHLANPVILPAGTVSFCRGGFLYVSGATANSTFQWQSSAGNIANQTNDSLYVTSSGSYTCVVTQGTSTTLTAVSVTILSISLTTPSTNICSGTSTLLTASGSTSGTYTWIVPSVSSAASVTVAPTTPSTYSVSGIVSGCNDTASISITIKPKPTASFTYSPNSGCPRKKRKLYFNSTSQQNGAGGLTYSWNFGDPNSGNNNTSNDNDPSHSFIGSGFGTSSTFTVTLTVTAANGCSSVSSQQITIGSFPDATLTDPINFPEFKICNSSNYNLTVHNSSSTVPINTNYQINWGDGTSDNTSLMNTDISHNYPTTGFFNLTFIVSAGGCKDSTDYEVYIGSNPAIGLTTLGSTTYLCLPSTKTFKIDTAVANQNPLGTIYTVIFNDGSPDIIFNHPPPATFNHTFTSTSCGATPTNQANTFEVKIFASNPCGTSPAQVGAITTIVLPQANFTITPDTIICINSIVTFTNTTINGTVVVTNGSGPSATYTCDPTNNFFWSISALTGANNSWTITGNPGIYPNATGNQSISSIFSQPGTYLIRLIVRNNATSPAACREDTIAKIICVQSPPSPYFKTTPKIGCSPLNVNFTDSSYNLPICSGVTRLWTVTKLSSTCVADSVSDYNFVNPTTNTSINPNIIFNNQGIYLVTLSLTNKCGTFIYTDTVKVKRKPVVTLNISTISVCQGGSTTPTITTLPCAGTITAYNWGFPGGTPSSYSSTTTPNPGSITYNSQGTFTIYDTVKNECGTTVNSAIINVYPIPTAPTVTANITYCQSAASSLLSATPTGSNILNWYTVATGGTASTTAPRPLTTTVGITTYYVSQLSSQGCEGPRAAITVEVVALPAATISGAATICSGSSATISFTGTPGATVNYTIGGVPQSAILDATGSASVSTGALTSSTTYSLVNVTSAAPNSCTKTIIGNIVVTIRPTPTATITGSTLICYNTSTTLTVTATANTIVTYTINSGTNQTISIGSTGSATISTGNLTSTATYNLVSVDYSTAPNCSQTLNTNFTVNVKPLPTATISGTATICANSTTTITFTGTPLATVTYNFNGTTPVRTITLDANGNASLTTIALNANATYNLVSVTTNGTPNCSTSVTGSAVVTVSQIPTATIGYGLGLCQSYTTPQAVTQTGTSGGTYSSNSMLLDLNTATGAINPSTTPAGTYTVTYSVPAANGCAAISTSTNVTITTPPSATISYAEPFCKSLTTPQLVTLTGTTGGTFSATPAGLSINTNTGAITPSASTAGAYLVTYTILASGGCPIFKATDSVHITALPIATISYVQPFCNSLTTAQSVSQTGTTGGTYSSSSAALDINTSIGAIIPSTSTPGVYTVIYTIAAANGCNSVTATAPVTITALPSATISYTSPYCTTLSTPQPVALTGTTGGLFSSTTGLTINTGTGAITPSTSTAGTYLVTYTIAAAGGCPIVKPTATLQIVSNPTATISYQQPFCNSVTTAQPVTQTGTIGGTYSSSSTALDINPSTGAITPSTSTPGTYTVTYSIAAANGCSAVTATTSVTITTLPTATIAYAGPYCTTLTTSQPVTLTGTSGGVFTSTTGLTINSGTGAITPSSSTAGSYIVTYTVAASGGCPAVTPTATLQIVSIPTATISYQQPFCNSVTTAQPVTQTGTIGGSYSSSSTALDINTSTGAITPSTSTPGTYTVTYSIAAANGCSVVTATTSVTITTLPSATITYAGPYCTTLTTSQPVTLTGTSGGVFTSTTGLTINSGTGAITPSSSTAGSYTVTYTIAAAGGCPPVTPTAILDIVSIPTASITYATPFCTSVNTPQNVTLTGNNGGGYSSVPSGLDLNTTTGAITPSSSTPGSYTITYFIAAANGCAAVSATAPVTITQLPVASISYNGPYCTSITAPQSVIQTGNGGGIYTSTPSGLSINQNTGAVTPSSSSDGSYTITYTIAASGGCPVVNPIAPLIINATPVVPGNNYTICSGTSFTYQPSSNGSNIVVPPGTLYNWQQPTILPTADSTTGAVASSGAGQPSVTATITNSSSNPVTVTYNVTPTAGSGCIGNNFTITVVVNPTPKVILSVGPDTICSGSSTQIVNISTPTNIANITWTSTASPAISGQALNGGNVIPSQTLQNNSTDTASVIYLIQISTTGQATCSGVPIAYSIIVNPTPKIGNYTKIICSRDSFNVIPVTNIPSTIVPAGTSYTWSVQSSDPGINPTSQNIPQTNIGQRLTNIVNIPQQVVYLVTPTSGVFDSCVGNPFTITITVNPVPEIPTLSSTICSGN
ncbi:MAG: PKD domain-containing protein, partial [Bacteroidota bacterium]